MKTVLVIGNDPVLGRQLTPWLGERGWSMMDAQDGQRGMELALQHAPEIVLCDVLCPRVRGSVLPGRCGARSHAGWKPFCHCLGQRTTGGPG